MRREQWSPAEDEFLRQHAQRMSIGIMADKLGRSYDAVKLRRYKLGILQQTMVRADRDEQYMNRVRRELRG